MRMTLNTCWWNLGHRQPTILEVTRMYDARAATRWQRSIERLGYLSASEDLFRHLQTAGLLPQLSAQARILDAGIGTGALTIALAQTMGIPCGLEGVDLSAEMLHQARQNCAHKGLAATLTQRDIRQLGFPEHSFDLVMSAHVLEHVPDPPVALNELVRVLRPSAPLLVLVSQPSLWTALLQWRWRFAAYPSHMVRHWLVQAGLDRVQIFRLQGGLPRRTSLAYLGFKV